MKYRIDRSIIMSEHIHTMKYIEKLHYSSCTCLQVDVIDHWHVRLRFNASSTSFTSLNDNHILFEFKIHSNLIEIILSTSIIKTIIDYLIWSSCPRKVTFLSILRHDGYYRERSIDFYVARYAHSIVDVNSNDEYNLIISIEFSKNYL
jgi:hypothetical protein